MRGSLGVGAASGASLILFGLSPAILSPSLGTMVTIDGLMLLVAFLAVVLQAMGGGLNASGRQPSAGRSTHRSPGGRQRGGL